MSDTSKDELLRFLRGLERSTRASFLGEAAADETARWITEVEQSVRISDEEAAVLGQVAANGIVTREHQEVLRLLSRRTRSTKELGVENG